MRKLLFVPLVVVLAGAVLLLDPAALWREEAFDYGAVEMRAAVEGTWEVRTPDRTFVFTAVQDGQARRQSSSRSWIRAAAACSHRSIVRSAEACIDVSEMDLEIHVAGEPDDASGKFEALGIHHDFDSGELGVRFGDHRLSATLDPRGNVRDAYLDEKPVGLVRTKR